MGLLMAGLAAATLATPAPPAAVPADAVAVVGDLPITRATFDHWLTVVEASDGVRSAPTQQTVQQTMDLLLSMAWLRAEAKLHGVEPSTAELDAAYRQEIRHSFRDEAALRRYLRTSGQTTDDLRELSALNVLRDRLTGRVRAAVPPVTELQAKRFLVDHRRRFREPARRTVRVVTTRRHADAVAARRALDAGWSFEAVVRRFSDDPRHALLRGVRQGSSELRLDRAIFSAPVGETTGPVRIGRLSYVFEVLRHRPGRPQRFSEVRGTIRQLLDSRAKQRALGRYQRRYEARWTAVTRCAPDISSPHCRA